MSRGAPIGPRRNGELPSRGVVEHAVKLACMITSANAADVLRGVNPQPRSGEGKQQYYQSITRARHYAAFALRAIYEEANWAKMATMLGARTPTQYYAIKDTAFRDGWVKWWDDKAFMRVIEETESFIKREKEALMARERIGAQQGAVT